MCLAQGDIDQCYGILILADWVPCDVAVLPEGGQHKVNGVTVKVRSLVPVSVWCWFLNLVMH